MPYRLVDPRTAPGLRRLLHIIAGAMTGVLVVGAIFLAVTTYELVDAVRDTQVDNTERAKIDRARDDVGGRRGGLLRSSCGTDRGLHDARASMLPRFPAPAPPDRRVDQRLRPRRGLLPGPARLGDDPRARGLHPRHRYGHHRPTRRLPHRQLVAEYRRDRPAPPRGAQMPPIQIVETDADQPFHVRFTGRNGEPIVDGENLADRSSALTSIAAVAEAFGITMDRPPEWDDEVGGVIGETPEGVVHTYLVVDVDEREPVDEAPDEEEAP